MFCVSCGTQAQDGAVHEGAGEGPRRIMSDVENISAHEKATGAKSAPGGLVERRLKKTKSARCLTPRNAIPSFRLPLACC